MQKIPRTSFTFPRYTLPQDLLPRHHHHFRTHRPARQHLVQIWIRDKGGKIVPIPLPPSVRDLLWPLRAHHPEVVFTYVARYTRTDASGPRVKGQRYPITHEGLQEVFRRTIKPVIKDYHFHDNRHTAATRLLRSSGNIRAAKELLRHSQIAMTMRYAHVTHDDLMAAMENAIQSPATTKSPDKSPDIAVEDAKTGLLST